MFHAVLITNPADPSLDPAAVDALRNAWGGGKVAWLAPDLAAEFPIAEAPGNRWDTWAEFQAMGVDLCVVPSANRRKRLLLADMDSTMIGQECIDELAVAAGVGEHVKGITKRAMNGELDFEEALRERVALMAGLATEVIGEVLETRIIDAPGASVTVATMRAHGAYAALVSGGFTAFSRPVAARLGFNETRANTLLEQNGKLTGKAAEPVLGRQSKIEALHELTAKLGITSDDVLAVGDGANDLGMLGIAGMGVALHAKPAVAAECDIRINHGDVTALLYLQGYSSEAFVSL